MRAPRRRADCHSSRTRKPAPSPSRKPLRVASNGRLARCGVSLSGDSAREEAESRDADRADHRVEATGERAVDRAAADQLQRRCRAPGRRTRTPCAPTSRSRGCRSGGCRSDNAGRRLAAAEHQRIVGAPDRTAARSGCSSPSPALCACVTARSTNSDVIIPAPTAQPQRVAVSAVGRIPASRNACSARHERETVRAVRELERACGRRSARSARKSLTSAAMRTGNPLASNPAIGAPPLLPASSASHVVATSLPTGVTSPMPVIATRLRSVMAKRASRRRRGARSLRSCRPSVR